MYHRMFKTVVCLAISLLTISSALAGTQSSDVAKDQYLMAVADYFEVSYEDVLSLKPNYSAEEIPVLFFLAQQAKVPVSRVDELQDKGQSWAETVSQLGLNATNVYVIISGEVKSETFAPIFEKYRTTPEQNWSKIQLSDEDIVNLVNLRVMYSQYDYSAYAVMAYRDANTSWETVNRLVADAKAEYLKNQMAEKEK